MTTITAPLEEIRTKVEGLEYESVTLTTETRQEMQPHLIDAIDVMTDYTIDQLNVIRELVRAGRFDMALIGQTDVETYLHNTGDLLHRWCDSKLIATTMVDMVNGTDTPAGKASIKAFGDLSEDIDGQAKARAMEVAKPLVKIFTDSLNELMSKLTEVFGSDGDNPVSSDGLDPSLMDLPGMDRFFASMGATDADPMNDESNFFPNNEDPDDEPGATDAADEFFNQQYGGDAA